jgi:hypothetical protein
LRHEGRGEPGLVGHRRRAELEERALVVVAAEDVRSLGDLAVLVEVARLVGEEVVVDDGRERAAESHAPVRLPGVEERRHGESAEASEGIGSGVCASAVGRAVQGVPAAPVVACDCRSTGAPELGGHVEDRRLVVGERRLEGRAPAALADGALEEGRGLRRRDVHAHVERSRGLAEDRHASFTPVQGAGFCGGAQRRGPTGGRA